MAKPSRDRNASNATSHRSARTRRSRSDFVALGLLVAFVALANVVPPDTSLREVREAGVLRACVPIEFPPLVTADAGAPGIDVELLRLLADGIGVNLHIVPNQAIGRDFNPRNWRINRAQCVLIAGGVVATDTTRSFLETLPPHVSTGWAAVRLNRELTLDGATVGFFAGLSGLDRIGLGRFLRGEGAEVRIVHDRAALVAGLASGAFDIAVTEALTARQVAGELDGQVMWLPEHLGRFPVAFGAWKGDLTLNRALSAVLGELRRTGELDAIVASYDVAAIDETCHICRDP